MIHPTKQLPDIAAAPDPRARLAALGTVFAAFDDQDSGCIAYGVSIDDVPWFVKIAPTPDTAAMLRSAAAFHAAVHHRVVLAPIGFADLGDRAVILYPWCEGRVLYHPTKSRREPRTDPASAMFRFRAQPLETVASVVDRIFDAHVAIAAADFVAVDFYDGCVLYDPATTTVRLIDLDLYRRGPFTVGPELLSGSQRFLSPEERTAGAVVDQRTTVYTLGRTALILMDEGDDEAAWRGTAAQLDVLRRATAPDPGARHPSVADFVTAWHAA